MTGWNDPDRAADDLAPARVEWAWAEGRGVTWENADDTTKESFALTRLFWFFRMIDCGGPDGSDLDTEVADQAREAAEWFGPILEARAKAAER